MAVDPGPGALATIARHRTALLPGAQTTVVIDRGPFGVRRWL